MAGEKRQSFCQPGKLDWGSCEALRPARHQGEFPLYFLCPMSGLGFISHGLQPCIVELDRGSG